jgi:hypothetical protein
MGDDQRTHGADIEFDCVAIAAAAVTRFTALKQAAVDQQAAVVVDVQLVAAAGDAVTGAVVLDFYWQILCRQLSSRVFLSKPVTQPFLRGYTRKVLPVRVPARGANRERRSR